MPSRDPPDPGALGRDLLAVGAGGAFGTVLRATVVLLLPPVAGALPWATTAVNLLGAFLMGALVMGLLHDRPDATRLRLFLLTGVLGSFTTFSALAVELVMLGAVDAAPGTAALYLAVSIPGGILAAWAGLRVGRGSGALPSSAT